MSVLAVRVDGFAVVPADLRATATTFADLRDRASSAACAAAADLAATSGMAGDDAILERWRRAYDPSSAALWTAVGVVAATHGALAQRLTDTGDAYLAADHAAAPNVPGPAPRLPGISPPGPSASGPPTCTGPDGVPDLVAEYYPGGDPDRLRVASRAWSRMADALDDTAFAGDVAFRGLVAANSGETFSAMRTFWARLFVPCGTGPMLNAVPLAARTLATSCAGLADLIDRTRAAVLGAVDEAREDMSPLEAPARLLGPLTRGVTQLELFVGTGALAASYLQVYRDAYLRDLDRLVAELEAVDRAGLAVLRVPEEGSAPPGTGLHDVGEVLGVGVRGSAWDRIGVEHPTPDMIAITPEKITHILDSDANGGGHAHGTGIPGKSEFPASWGRTKIMEEVLSLARDPGSIERTGRIDGGVLVERWQVQGVRDGVRMRVIVDDDGSIVTAFPRGGPGVHQNPKQR